MEIIVSSRTESVFTKSTPILFTPANTLANLQGRKTMTRRLIKFPFHHSTTDDWKQAVQIPNDHTWIFWDHNSTKNIALTAVAYKPGAGIGCPYGIPGDELWTRETAILERHGRLWATSDPAEVKVTYLADGSVRYYLLHGEEKENFKPGKKPAIFLPRFASRQSLLITSVRPEILQSISIDDIIAEGCPKMSCDADASELYQWYSNLWDSLNAKPKPVYQKAHSGTKKEIHHYASYPWEDIRETRSYRGKPWFVFGNPWVWVIQYQLLELGVDSFENRYPTNIG